MGSVFKTPKAPKPPPPPVYDDAAEEARKKVQRYSGLGREATILTSPLGILGEGGGFKKTLLGG